MTPDDLSGCWHYDFARFCVQCDPASYGACEDPCSYEHECCTCDRGEPGECAVHPDGEEIV